MAVEIGSEAPDFELRDQHGESVRLADFRGERHVLLVFYPFAFTGVCTAELGALRDELSAFQNDEVQVLAVSCDAPFSLRVFAEGEGYAFPLLSDFWPHGAAARAYGVFAEDKGCALRASFVIDRDGVIRWSVVNAMPDARDGTEYHRALAAL
ncbi:peroxiredoxin [Embleya scabrispora]|uniref:Alkyl hydroperoxide reductase E n=1 Tax=Embleya scabrispora TaxID=159449 RepID=A0A1T3P7A0_9ACTN|nr:peroxiredoxin [Embleya scabrispora]OPC84882.1 peroxiredoxin [Embleya scabrispora]